VPLSRRVGIGSGYSLQVRPRAKSQNALRAFRFYPSRDF
jgi:hypothetical protein